MRELRIREAVSKKRYDAAPPQSDITNDIGEPKRSAKVSMRTRDTPSAHSGDSAKAAVTAIFAKPGLIPGSGEIGGNKCSRYAIISAHEASIAEAQRRRVRRLADDKVRIVRLPVFDFYRYLRGYAHDGTTAARYSSGIDAKPVGAIG